MLDTISLFSNFNIIGSAIGIAVGMSANELIKAIVEGIILPIFSLFVKKGTFETMVFNVGKVQIKTGEVLSQLIYFMMVIFVVILILRFFLNGLIKSIVEKKGEANLSILKANKDMERHLEAIRYFNVPI